MGNTCLEPAALGFPKMQVRWGNVTLINDSHECCPDSWLCESDLRDLCRRMLALCAPRVESATNCKAVVRVLLL